MTELIVPLSKVINIVLIATTANYDYDYDMIWLEPGKDMRDMTEVDETSLHPHVVDVRSCDMKMEQEFFSTTMTSVTLQSGTLDPQSRQNIILNCTDQETTTLDNFVVLGKSIESIWSVSCDGTISILLDTIIETCEVRARYLVTLKEDHQPGTPR